MAPAPATVTRMTPDAHLAAMVDAVPAVVDGGGGHEPFLVHEGTWTLARCPCGWAGPRRRALASADRDRAAHVSPLE